ncbi:MAG: sulfotransferase family protein [Pararhodobacter sp.]
MSRPRPNVADILCIGAQRAMTSWLHHVLSAHPGTWAFPDFGPVTSTAKEAHYWDWNHHRGPDWYRVLMTPPGDPGRLSMDFTPEYAFLSDAQISECRALNPQARIIYILRDPLARAVSALRMHTMWATDNAPPGTVTLDLDATLLERVAHARLHVHGDYAANHARWAHHYDVLVLNFEDLCTNPTAGLDRVLAHLGLSRDAMPPAARAEFDARAARPIWQTPRYRFTPDALDFLHGLLWRERQATEESLGLRFDEWRSVLADAQPRPTPAMARESDSRPTGTDV